MKSAILLTLALVASASAQSLKYSHFVPGHNVVFSVKESGTKDRFSREAFLKDTTFNSNEWAIIRTCTIASENDSCGPSRNSLTLTRESSSIDGNQKVAWQYSMEVGSVADSHTVYVEDTVLEIGAKKMTFRKEATCTVDGHTFSDCFHIFQSADSSFYEVYLSASEGMLRKEQRRGTSYSFLAQRVFSGASSTRPKVVVTPLRPRSYLVNGRAVPTVENKFQTNKK